MKRKGVVRFRAREWTEKEGKRYLQGESEYLGTRGGVEGRGGKEEGRKRGSFALLGRVKEGGRALWGGLAGGP